MGNQKIAIVTDSSAYIPKEAIGDLPIHVIPVWLLWDGEHLREGVDIDSPTFYKRLVQSKTMPTTSQPSIGEFVEFYKGLAKRYDAIVAVLVSNRMSGTVASALGAVKELPNIPIRVVDSLGGSMGHGFVALAAARAAAVGKSIKEVVSAAKNMIPRVRFMFAVDTLEYLRRSGRISGAKAVFGNLLRVKPLLQFKDGMIQPHSQVRTKRKALGMLLDAAEEILGGRAIAEAAVIDIDTKEEGDAFADQVMERFGITDIIRGEVSPVVGAIVGPGTLGLAFYAED